MTTATYTPKDFSEVTCAVTGIPFAASTEFSKSISKFAGLHPAFNLPLSTIYSEVSRPLFSSHSTYSEVTLAIFIPIFNLGLISKNAMMRGAFPLSSATRHLEQEHKKRGAIKIAIELIKTITSNSSIVEQMIKMRELPQVVPSALDFQRLIDIAKDLIIQIKGKAFVKNASANGRAALELKFANIETVETYARELLAKSTRTDYLHFFYNIIESYPEVFTSRIAEEKLTKDEAIEVITLAAMKNYSVLAENYANLNTLQTMLLQVADKVGINAIEHSALMQLLDKGATKVLEVLKAKHKNSFMVDIGTTTYKSKGITVNMISCDTLSIDDLMPTIVEVKNAKAEKHINEKNGAENESKVESLKSLMAKLAK